MRDISAMVVFDLMMLDKYERHSTTLSLSQSSINADNRSLSSSRACNKLDVEEEGGLPSGDASSTPLFFLMCEHETKWIVETNMEIAMDQLFSAAKRSVA